MKCKASNIANYKTYELCLQSNICIHFALRSSILSLQPSLNLFILPHSLCCVVSHCVHVLFIVLFLLLIVVRLLHRVSCKSECPRNNDAALYFHALEITYIRTNEMTECAREPTGKKVKETDLNHGRKKPEERRCTIRRCW